MLANLAELEFADGQVEQAVRLAAEGLEIQSRGKNASRLAIGHNNIAAYRIALGRCRWRARGCPRGAALCAANAGCDAHRDRVTA